MLADGLCACSSLGFSHVTLGVSLTIKVVAFTCLPHLVMTSNEGNVNIGVTPSVDCRLFVLIYPALTYGLESTSG